jgi:hypothetical protein
LPRPQPRSGARLTVFTYDRVLAGHRVRVAGTDQGCVNVSSTNVLLGITVGVESRAAWTWAYRADSVSRLPAHPHTNEEIDFAPVETGSSDRAVYERIVDGDTLTEHRLWFRTSYGYRFGVWLSRTELHEIVAATVAAAKLTDSLTIKTTTAFCY